MADSSMMNVRTESLVLLVVFFLPAVGLSQLPSSRCHDGSELPDCNFPSSAYPARGQVFPSKKNENPADSVALPDRFDALAKNEADFDQTSFDQAATGAASEQKQGIHWVRALTESFTFLIIEQGYVVHTDFHWVVSENGIPFNHYARDYGQSLTSWWRAGWSAGEDPLYNYVGHPIQGAMTSYIEIQNDPKNENVEYANTKAYWFSRLKATIWNTVYSTQWSMGPLSEMTVEKYGTKDRPPWNANGSFPCNTKTCYSGVGKVNLVMTPVGGLGWVLAEDILDKKIAEELVEAHTSNEALIDTIRCALNPIRGGANILHGRHPWYRPRDLRRWSIAEQKKEVAAREGAKPPIPSHGDVFLGYSHASSSHCEQVFSGGPLACDPLSAATSKLGGWDVSLEKKYLRYFGAVADFSGQYGGANQNDYLFGIRGGASVWRFRPFTQVLFGAVHARAITSGTTYSGTSFAEDLGAGLDFRLARLVSWRNEIDVLKTGTPDITRYNVRESSGVAVRF